MVRELVEVGTFAVCYMLRRSREKRISYAKSVLEKEVAKEKKGSLLSLVLGGVFSARREIDSAIEALELFLSEQGDNAPVQLHLGHLYSRKEDWENAVKTYQSVVEFGEKAHDVGEAQYRLACSYKALGRHEEAADVFQAVLQKEPTSVRAYISLGHCMLLLGRIDEAVDVLEAGRPLAPNNPDLLYYLGRAFHRSARYDDGIAALRNALREDAGYAAAASCLAACYQETGDAERARLFLENFVSRNPSAAQAHHALGSLYLTQGNRDAAMRQCQLLAELDDGLRAQLEEQISGTWGNGTNLRA